MIKLVILSRFVSLIVPSVVDLRASIELHIWESHLSHELQMTSKSQPTATPHKLMLHLAYWWLVILLHRPFFDPKSRPIQSTDPEIDHIKVSNISLRFFAGNLYIFFLYLSIVVVVQKILWTCYILGAPSTRFGIAQ